MFGLLALGLTSIMIFTLVKNALMGKQFSKDDEFRGSVELMIPVLAHSQFYLDSWMKVLDTFKSSSTTIKIHFLIDGHHSSLNELVKLKTHIPGLEIHGFVTRPQDVEPVAWMISQISDQISGQVVIVGDCEITPTAKAFSSAGKFVSEKGHTYFIIPQIAKLSLIGEAISSLNPTLAFASFFGFKKWRKNLSHPLMNVSSAWMALPLETFKKIDFKNLYPMSWKERLAKQLDENGKSFYLAFGEKHLTKSYPADTKVLIHSLKDFWADLWLSKSNNGFWYFLVAVLLWSFPLICFITHPFWSVASILLLMLYRFFSKVVFQERWRAAFLHPIACVALILSFTWWLSDHIKNGQTLKARV